MNTETAEEKVIRKGKISNKSLNMKSSLEKSGCPRAPVDTEVLFPLPPLFSLTFVKVCVFSLFCLSKPAFCLSVFCLTFIFIIFYLK